VAVGAPQRSALLSNLVGYCIPSVVRLRCGAQLTSNAGSRNWKGLQQGLSGGLTDGPFVAMLSRRVGGLTNGVID